MSAGPASPYLLGHLLPSRALEHASDDAERAGAPTTRIMGQSRDQSPKISTFAFYLTVPIDVAHVDARGRVVQILHRLRPWRLGPIAWRSAWVIELPVGTARATGMHVSDRVGMLGGADATPGT
jgi:hypothetical protein